MRQLRTWLLENKQQILEHLKEADGVEGEGHSRSGMHHEQADGDQRIEGFQEARSVSLWVEVPAVGREATGQVAHGKRPKPHWEVNSPEA